MSTDPAHLPQQGNLPENPMSPVPMDQEIRTHQQKLEEIRKKLNPGAPIDVLDTDVKSYQNDIKSIFDYMEEIEGTDDILTYVTSVSLLISKLIEIMLELKTSLFSWNLSNDVDRTSTQRSDARHDYMRRLSNCYGLLKDALKYFISGK